MSRKVFISVLGATNYSECEYYKDDKSFGRTRFIQVSILRMLTSGHEWSGSDSAYILLTDQAEKSNWVDDGQKKPKTNEVLKQHGLKSCLQTLANEVGTDFFPSIVPVYHLPMGNNRQEIWQVFNEVFSRIQEGDELYFDLTHGFRYLPMLILVLGNYAKFLKHAKVKSITYGNYEVSNRGQLPAPIIDLEQLSQLQDWTFAAGQYLDSGSVERLKELSNTDDSLKEVMTLLDKVIKERQTCRGISIITSETFKRLKESMDGIKTTNLPPLNPVLDKIKASFNGFSVDENVMNGYNAARWCIKNKLYMQAVTITLETMFTDVCMGTGYDWQNKTYRDWAGSSFYIALRKLPEEKWKINEKLPHEQQIQQKKAYDAMTASERLQSLLPVYIKIVELRNDLDHAGMRANAMSTEKLEKQFKQLSEIIPVCS